eukprot:TRINITY_DN8916_c0_g1_i1.p1 TRINITY_DN8916_c0_g1~~TRINITY_DN8916_c0_g1_i1.p1  ORF type:complete len:252 (-),score=78.93 TRINITY_DN8916_c0_g1_i1:105-860(-)
MSINRTFNFGVSGITISCLIPQISTTNSDLEGLIFGTVSTVQQTSLVDEDIDSITEDNTITIQSFKVIGKSFSFYNKNGQVLGDKLLTETANSQLTLLGWFKFRRHSSLRPSIREIEIHESFCNFIDANPKLRPNKFVPLLFGIFSQRISGAGSQAQSIEFRFVKKNRDSNTFTPIDITTFNLQKGAQKDYADFKLLSSPSIANSIFTTTKPDFLSQLNPLHNFNQSLLNQLQQLAEEIHSVEKEINKLQS